MVESKKWDLRVKQPEMRINIAGLLSAHARAHGRDPIPNFLQNSSRIQVFSMYHRGDEEKEGGKGDLLISCPNVFSLFTVSSAFIQYRPRS